MDGAEVCWGCGQEAPVDGTLGEACRARLREGRRDPASPRIDAMLDRLEDGYTRLCWNCQVELSTAISGLCPLCEAELRR